MVGVELVSVSKPWDSKAKTRLADMERSWTTNLTDYTATGTVGSTPGSMLVAGAWRWRMIPMAAETRDYTQR